MSKAKTLSTNKLIHSIKLRAALPSTQNTFQEEDFLYFINEEIDLGVVPHVLSFHEDYFLYSDEIPTVSGETRYQIPYRAIGSKLRDITYSDGSTLYEMTRISKEDLSDRVLQFDYMYLRDFYIESDEIVIPKSLSNTGSGKLIVSYYIRPNTIVSEDAVAIVTEINRNNGLITVDKFPETFIDMDVFDITSSKSSFRLISKETAPDGIATDSNLNYTFGSIKSCDYNLPVIGSIPNSSYIQVIDSSQEDASTNVYWFDISGSATAPTVSGANLYRVNCSACITTSDIIGALLNVFNSSFVDGRLILTQVNSSVFNIENGGPGISVGNNFSVTATSLSITETVLQAGEMNIPTKLSVGDIFALPEETIIPQIPIELHSMLAQRVAMRCLESLGDLNGLQAAAAKLQDMENKTGNLIDNRVESSPLKIVPRHTPIKRNHRRY